jgi:hypothetical protein
MSLSTKSRDLMQRVLSSAAEEHDLWALIASLRSDVCQGDDEHKAACEAAAIYANDDLMINEDARVSLSGEGAWVEAWVFVRGDYTCPACSLTCRVEVTDDSPCPHCGITPSELAEG